MHVPRALVVRHRQSTYNAERRWTAHDDPPLSETGRREAEHLAARLDGLGVARVVCSDLRRARETAEAAARALGLPGPAEDPRLREHAVPAFAGRTREEIESRHPGALAAWREHGVVPDLPGSEPWDAMEDRVIAALRDHRGPGVTLVVAHAGVLRAIHTALGGDAPRFGRWKARWVRWDGDVPRLGAVHRFDRPAC
jgi:probable phosphoglycerate mutase